MSDFRVHNINEKKLCQLKNLIVDMTSIASSNLIYLSTNLSIACL